MQLAAKLALAIGLAAFGATATARGDDADGVAHFAQFDANCIATGASGSAIAAKAERDGWTVVERDLSPLMKGVSGTAKAWTYTVAGREYQLVLLDGTNAQPVLDLKNLPFRECAITTERTQGLGALGAMKKKLATISCERIADAFSMAHAIEWRGRGYLIRYSLVSGRSRQDNTPMDALTLIRVGADKAVTEANLRDGCVPKT